MFKTELDKPKNFWAWGSTLVKKNRLLEKEKMTDNALIELMVARLPRGLEERVRDADPALPQTDVRKWMEAVRKIVDAHQRDEKRESYSPPDP